MTERKAHSLWYKDAIFYELHAKAFYDADGDGMGDLRGLMEKLDYIQDLGVTAIWLLPFYPSPLRDDGYDISDYRGIHPNYGTLRDFRALVRQAHRRGLKVITELVVNHTSDQHPWFQAARRAKPGSARREMFIWSDTDKKFPETRIIFTDTEKSNWAWDPIAGAYYWHRFFSHQPDLNHNNPRVVQAVAKVLRFWLDQGVDGLRLDAVPYLCVREGTNNENLPETHAAIRELRRQVDLYYDDRMLLAEANQWPDDVRPYFGDGDECHMAFHFPLMPRIFMAVRREDRRPIVDIVQRTPEIPESCQWALFLRNHDELTLEMVTDEERDYMYREYAKDPRMRVNVGIRRRLAPLLDNGMRRIELLNSLLFSFPGSPVVYYGDELGMGDNIFLGDRDGVRTPMQWTLDRNAGFSRADPARLYLPPIMDPVYGYGAINVESQQRDPSSLLQFMKRIISLRRQHKAFGRGAIEFLHPRNRRVLAYLRRYEGEAILCVANLSRFAQPVELDLKEFDGWTPLEMFGHSEFPKVGELPYLLTLGPHSFYWFRLEPQAEPIRVAGPLAGEHVELPTLKVDSDFDAVFGDDFRYTLLQDVLAPWISRQRWFQGKAREAVGHRLVDRVKLGAGFHIVIVEVSYADGAAERYVLPLKLAEGDPARRIADELPGAVLARLRTPETEGILTDGLADSGSCRTLFAAMRDGHRLVTEGGGRTRGLSFGGEGAAATTLAPGTVVRRLAAEQSNTSIVLGDVFILKCYRRIEDGPNPDLEIARYLTAHPRFDHIAPLLGAIEYERVPGGTPSTLAMLQRFVPSDGDGWSFTLGQLEAWFDAGCGREAMAPSIEAAALLGRRTAECHQALAEERRDPAFAPVPMTTAYLQRTADQLARHAQNALSLLGEASRSLPRDTAAAAHQVLGAGERLAPRFRRLPELGTRAVRIRVHGDYHLGQVLRSHDDFILIDFEGEPLRSLEERRAKHPPFKDVAGMLRSYGYAAHAGLTRAVTRTGREISELRPAAREWEAAVGGAFLEAYLETAAGAPFLPEDETERTLLLDAFVLDKAFYELEYELNNRPDWVRIPLDGILVLAGREPEENRE